MDNITELNAQKNIDSETMQKIREHANLYDSAYDKKEFLKNVSVHEQKIILMNSSKPYEVLNYLDELDLKSSRLLLQELNYDEIKHIISLFSAEDKKRFYATFSDLSLVNQFISQDKNSHVHVQNLSFDRKVDLIDSSDKQTEVATSVIYESMPLEERVSASEKVTDVNASYTLESTAVYNETQESLSNEEQQTTETEQVQQEQQVQQDEQVEEQPETKQEEKTEKEEKKEEQKEEINQEEKERPEESKEKLVNEEQSDIVNLSNTQEVIQESAPDVLEQFQEERNKCEQQEILNLVKQTQQIVDEFAKVM